MVLIYNDTYPSESQYNDKFQNYDFEVDHFQKYAIQSIEENKHVLITAHTGSGKTLPAEYAIQKYCNAGKKVIYTAPIKSLSNQKFNEFTKKFPNITFGILTGDIKFNPDAQCIIMTTEILRNTLFQKKMKTDKDIMLFDMDIENELGCVIFDEIHYINDEDRGKVWEESIMLVPHHISLVMLSATIDNIHKFAEWIEKTTEKEVAICSTEKRIVPLIHQSYITAPNVLLKYIPKEKHKEFNNIINHPQTLKDSNNKFSDRSFYNIKMVKDALLNNNVYVKPSFVLNNFIKYLNDSDLLPAICFVFSRKNVEKYANMININLIDNSYEIENECLSIIKKLQNYKEYIETEEYLNMLHLLKKGVAIHHSGVIPILREIVELMFSKGHIKVLFATETFAVGVNMPTKTVAFTNFMKYSSRGYRYILPHEYTQMAGRAGRRGLDKIGYVIHLSNIMEIPVINDYKIITNGRPQSLISKFKIHYNLILQLIASGKNMEEFINNSMINNEINKEYDLINTELLELENKYNNKKQYTKQTDELKLYHKLHSDIIYAKNKENRRIRSQINNYDYLKKDYEKYKELIKLEENINNKKTTLINIKNYITDTNTLIKNILLDNNFIEYKDDQEQVTIKGMIASHIQEVHSLALSDILTVNFLQELTPEEIAGYLSIFTHIVVNEENDIQLNNIKNQSLYYALNYTYNKMIYYEELEEKHHLDKVCEYRTHYNLCDIMIDWCRAENENDCKAVYFKLKEKKIFVGEFIKAILKINNIINEIEKICNITNNIELLQKINEIPKLTLKNIVTNQSLYL
uniref:Helicase n=1 Tax=viral metagenome TaxID=1070528 RepID=A0A6C0KEM3_9ZZZZ